MTKTLLDPDSTAQAGWRSPQISVTSRKGLPEPALPPRYGIRISELRGRALRAPLVLRVEQGQALLHGGVDRLGVHVTANSLESLIEELTEEVEVLLDHYAGLREQEVIGEARRPKSELERLFLA